MSNKKSFINIEEPIYNLIVKYKKIDIVAAAILDNIEYLNRGKGYYKKNETIALEFGLSERTVTRKIKQLVDLGYIEIEKSSPTNRKVTLTNYFKEYLENEIDILAPRQNDQVPRQNGETAKTKWRDSLDKMARQPRQNGETHISNEFSNDTSTDIRNDISNIINNYFEDNEINILFNDFLENRKELFGKKINTDRSIKALVKKLKEYNNKEKKAMINTAIESGWKSVFPVTNKKQQNNNTMQEDYERMRNM